MLLLLDTHAFIWWVSEPARLPNRVVSAIADESNDILVSAVSAWEITTKHHLGRLPSVAAIAEDIVGAIAVEEFRELPLTVAEAALAGALPGPHRDPFDRMLIAQALERGVALVSNEAVFDRYGVHRVW